jgi:hypothetical protein
MIYTITMHIINWNRQRDACFNSSRLFGHGPLSVFSFTCCCCLPWPILEQTANKTSTAKANAMADGKCLFLSFPYRYTGTYIVCVFFVPCKRRERGTHLVRINPHPNSYFEASTLELKMSVECKYTRLVNEYDSLF